MTFDELFDGSNAHSLTHVVPTNDLREHITDGDCCWCNPFVDDLVVIHNRLEVDAALATIEELK